MIEKKPKIPPEAMRYMTLGVEFIGVFLVCLVIGILIDRRWDSSPAGTLVGMVAGFAGAMYRILRVAKQYEDDERKPPSTKD